MIPAAHRLLIDVLRAIEPSGSQKERAKASHEFLRRQLARTPVAERIERILLIGSYARRTAVAPIDDIDLLIVLKSDAWPTAWLSSVPDPDRVLGDVHRSIKRAYPRTPVRKQRRSIGIRKARQPIDVVPALPTSSDGVFLIPDRAEGDWIETSPTLYARRVQELNRGTAKRFVPAVKLLKHWNASLPQSRRLKSFAVETVAGHLFARRMPRSLDDALLLFFDFITYVSGPFGATSSLQWSSNYGVSLGPLWSKAADLGGLGVNVLKGVELSRAMGFANKARIARDRLLKIEDHPTDATIRRELGALLKVQL